MLNKQPDAIYISKIYFYSIQFIKLSLQMSQMGQKRGPPVPYNFVEEIPIRYEERSCTDVFCTIVGLIFTLVLLIFAFVRFNYGTYLKSNFPTDSDGNLCGVDAPAYPYVYFANAPDFTKRICVTNCPAPSDPKLNCLMTEQIGCMYSDSPGFEVKKYDVAASDSRIGLYCLPTDDNLRGQLLHNANLERRSIFINSLDTIVLSMILSISFAIIYFVLVQCIPKVMNKVVIILAILVILALSICAFTYYHDITGRVVIGVIFIILFLIIVLSSIKNRRSVEMNGIFLDNATKMLSSEKWGTFFYIPLFIILLTAFILLIVYEFRSFWAGGSLAFDANKSLFWQFNSPGPIILSSFMIVQVIWGLSFLKEAFNYCVSGNAVSWYYYPPGSQWSCSHPLRTLLCKHFGSVVGGSFMTGFFTVGDYLFDLIKPRVSSKKTGIHYRCWNTCCGPCNKLFDLVRSDAMAYINITGNPYCNSARYCEYLSSTSFAVEQNSNTSRTYRLCAHLTIAGIVGIICLYVKGTIAPISLLVMLLLSLFISTFFISLHADAAEAIAISFMDNEECERRRHGTQYEMRQNRMSQSQAYQGKEFKRQQIIDDVKRVLDTHPYKEGDD